MAHSIRNSHIIHLIEEVGGDYSYLDDYRYRYICIHAVRPTPSKSTKDPSKVTCKNCLRKMKK